MCTMDSPRGGFRRAALISWTLSGIGIAGVAGTSALAYSDTAKPPVAEAPVLPGEPAPNSAPQAPVAPSMIVDAAIDSEPIAAPAPITPSTAPVASEPPPEVPVPRSSQTYSPAPEPTATLRPPAPAPTPTTKVQNGFPIRTSHSPAGGGSSTNKFTPHTVSRGS